MLFSLPPVWEVLAAERRVCWPCCGVQSLQQNEESEQIQLDALNIRIQPNAER